MNAYSDQSSLFCLGERVIADQWAVPGGLNKGQATPELLIISLDRLPYDPTSYRRRRSEQQLSPQQSAQQAKQS